MRIFGWETRCGFRAFSAGFPFKSCKELKEYCWQISVFLETTWKQQFFLNTKLLRSIVIMDLVLFDAILTERTTYLKKRNGRIVLKSSQF